MHVSRSPFQCRYVQCICNIFPFEPMCWHTVIKIVSSTVRILSLGRRYDPRGWVFFIARWTGCVSTIWGCIQRNSHLRIIFDRYYSSRRIWDWRGKFETGGANLRLAEIISYFNINTSMSAWANSRRQEFVSVEGRK